MMLPIQERSGIRVVTVSGRIDHASSAEFALALNKVMADCAQGKAPVLLDFSAVLYISSAGLRALMVASRQAKAARGVFAIAQLTPLVQEVFAISRFNLIVPCYGSVDAAIDAMRA